MINTFPENHKHSKMTHCIVQLSAIGFHKNRNVSWSGTGEIFPCHWYVTDHLSWNEYGTILEHEIQFFLRVQCVGV